METGVGKRIKARRIELNLTQEELAHRMGYKSKAAICKVEGGEDNLAADRLCKFADALETTPAHLMGWEEDDGLTIVDLNDFPDVGIKELKEALDLFKRFQSLPPEKQQALQILLEVPQNEP